MRCKKKTKKKTANSYIKPTKYGFICPKGKVDMRNQICIKFNNMKYFQLVTFISPLNQTYNIKNSTSNLYHLNLISDFNLISFRE